MTDENHEGKPDLDAGQCATLARRVVTELLSLMGYALEVRSEAEPDRIVLHLDGEAAAELIGHKGQTLDALQFIVNRIVSRQARDHTPVVLDAGGYRERRIEALRELAARLSEQAQRSGKIVAVNPMSAHDRRVIHLALREVQGVTTRSEGEGESRRLLIVPVPKS